jgi:hypothetical protein
MTIEKLREMVEKDTVLNDLELDREAIRIPSLHGKYLGILLDEKMLYRKLEKDYQEELKFKWEYFTGKTDSAILLKRNLDPFPLKILKNDLDLYINADTTLSELNLKVKLQQYKIEYLEGVIKELNNRQWVIRSIIDWRKFTNGVN